MNYGTYSTIDCVTGGDANEKKAYDYLTKEFGKIGGRVKEMLNPHDSGLYPSFEIDYPQDIFDLKENEDAIGNEGLDKLDNWHNQADIITEDYNKKFEEWL